MILDLPHEKWEVICQKYKRRNKLQEKKNSTYRNMLEVLLPSTPSSKYTFYPLPFSLGGWPTWFTSTGLFYSLASSWIFQLETSTENQRDGVKWNQSILFSAPSLQGCFGPAVSATEDNCSFQGGPLHMTLLEPGDFSLSLSHQLRGSNSSGAAVYGFLDCPF